MHFYYKKVTYREKKLETSSLIRQRVLKTVLCLRCPGFLSGPRSCSSPPLGRVSAQWDSNAGVPGLPLLSRHRPLHSAHRGAGPSAFRPHSHRPAVSAACLLVSVQEHELREQGNTFTKSFRGV